jgi:gluconate 5-dehydrogenase
MIKNLFNLDSKTALITGAGQGIGYTLAEGLGKTGARIILNDRNKGRLEKSVQKLNKQGIRADGALFDVQDYKAIVREIKKIQDKVGSIDILINNAGIQIRGSLETFKVDHWQKIIGTNLTAVFLVSKAVVPMMIERGGGKIINICSVQSELARPTIAPYTASKGGVKMLTKGMATDWGKFNIQVNGLAPGYFRTLLTKPLYEDKKFDTWLRSRTPANRWGNPEELVGAAIFLASKASDYVNGHILYVDGGLISCV